MSRIGAEYRIGIDTGGTFADLVALDRKGETRVAKAPSTPADRSVGVLDRLERMAGTVDLNQRCQGNCSW